MKLYFSISLILGNFFSNNIEMSLHMHFIENGNKSKFSIITSNIESRKLISFKKFDSYSFNISCALSELVFIKLKNSKFEKILLSSFSFSNCCIFINCSNNFSSKFLISFFKFFIDISIEYFPKNISFIFFSSSII